MTAPGVTAYGDQYMEASNFLDRTWQHNRTLSHAASVADAVRRGLGEPWEGKENGHGYLLVPHLGICQELNPGLTEPGDLLAFMRGVLGDRRPVACDLCERPIAEAGRWLPVAVPPTLFVLAVCDLDAALLASDYRDLTYVEETP